LLARARRVEKDLRDLLGELGDALGRGGTPSLPEYELTAQAERSARSTCLISGMKKINDTIRFTLESSREEVLLAQPIVVDHHVVIVPTNSKRTEAAMFTDPAVARFAGDLFERFWTRAIVFESAALAETANLVGTEVQEAVKRLVIEGKTDEQIGRRVGLKPRAVQNHLRRIKNELGASSRSELCFLLGQQSVLEDLALEETPGA
jgi:DNA-binding CsgD family transcriptional regulator